MNYSLISDSTLVSNYLNGEERALELLILKHRDRIYNFIYSKVYDKDIAEDLFQDTFIKVINTLKRNAYNEKGKFASWVMRISHNLIIDFFRKKNRMPKFHNTDEFNIFSVLGDGNMNIENVIIRDQIYSDLKYMLEELPEDQKDVVLMRIYNNMSFNEISDRIGISINTALGRMRYALINLRKIMDKHDIALTA